MKKTVTLPDGTTEVLEGTPEEIATHERLIRERSQSTKKKPGVLKGAPEEVRPDPEVVRKLQELIEATRENKPVAPWWQQYDLAPRCWVCGERGCAKVHDSMWPTPTIIYGTFTTTTNSLNEWAAESALTCRGVTYDGSPDVDAH